MGFAIPVPVPENARDNRTGFGCRESQYLSISVELFFPKA